MGHPPAQRLWFAPRSWAICHDTFDPNRTTMPADAAEAGKVESPDFRGESVDRLTHSHDVEPACGPPQSPRG